MTERSLILSTHTLNTSSTIPKNWLGELFGLIGRKFDALASLVTRVTGF